MVRVKICGITNIEDALKAVELGADALGFIFAPSPREINPAKAKEIIEKLPPLVTAVGVFVDEKIDTVKYIAEQCGLNAVQLHGNETPEYCEQLNLKIIKTIKNETKLMNRYDVSAFLIDTYDPKLAGGTGRISDWDFAVKIKKYGKPVILSGGLTHENVQEAIKKVKPYGVDVNSGIESQPGKKDYKKMSRFMQEVYATQ